MRHLTPLILFACNPSTTPGTDLPTGLPEDPSWTWSFAEPYPSVQLVDLDGDGDLEAITRSLDSELITGPLLADRTLPDDADTWFIGGTWSDYGLGDADGDGLVDVELLSNGFGTVLVLGPFVGDIDVASVGLSLPGFPASDLDGDGLLDLVSGHDPDLNVTWGPLSRWSGPPDLTLTPPACASTPAAWNGWQGRPVAYPDVDGDGVRELLASVSGPADTEIPYHDCDRLLMPLPADGTYDPEAVPGVVIDPSRFEVIPDQSGDGEPDVTSAGKVFVAPVTFRDGQEPTAAESWDRAPAWPVSVFSDLDLDGDGIGEVVVSDGDVARVMSGGPSLASATDEDAWEGRTFDVTGGWPLGLYVEDGTAFLLASRSYEIVLFDLGQVP
ncbi:MAG: hypothetical protein KC621_17500 [Myxococcales bacterium]|nr:hypothetical protein [Myxococcales bacterium]